MIPANVHKAMPPESTVARDDWLESGFPRIAMTSLSRDEVDCVLRILHCLDIDDKST